MIGTGAGERTQPSNVFVAVHSFHDGTVEQLIADQRHLVVADAFDYVEAAGTSSTGSRLALHTAASEQALAWSVVGPYVADKYSAA